MNERFGFDTFYYYMTDAEILAEIEKYSETEGNTLVYAPMAENPHELAKLVKFMKEELKLLVTKVETLADETETTYYIIYKKRPSYLVRVK